MTGNDASDIVLRRIPGECAKFALATNRVVYFDESLMYRLSSENVVRPLPPSDLNHPDILHSVSDVSPTQPLFLPMAQVNNKPLRVPTQRHPVAVSECSQPSNAQHLETPVGCEPVTTPIPTATSTSTRDENFIPPPGFFDKGGPSAYTQSEDFNPYVVHSFIDPDSVHDFSIPFDFSNFEPEDDFNNECRHLNHEGVGNHANIDEGVDNDSNPFDPLNSRQESQVNTCVDNDSNPFDPLNSRHEGNPGVDTADNKSIPLDILKFIPTHTFDSSNLKSTKDDILDNDKAQTETPWINGKVVKVYQSADNEVNSSCITSFSELSLCSSDDTSVDTPSKHDVSVHRETKITFSFAKKQKNINPTMNVEKQDTTLNLMSNKPYRNVQQKNTDLVKDVKNEMKRTDFTRDFVRKMAQKHIPLRLSSSAPKSPAQRKRSSESMDIDLNTTTPPQIRRRSESINVADVRPNPRKQQQRKRAESCMVHSC